MTNTDPFEAPATAVGIDYKELNGALLLFSVTSVETGVVTSLGEKDAVRCNVAVLDGPQAGQTYDDTLIFPRVLIGQLRSRVGGMVLGRLGQGAAKPGQNPPWKLAEPTDDDKAKGRAHLAANAPAPPF